MNHLPVWSRQTLLFTVALCVSAAAGAAMAAFGASTEATLAYFTAVVLAIPVVRRVATGSFDIFEPMIAFVFVFSLIFVVRPIYMYANDVDTFEIATEVASIGDSLDSMQLAALLGAIGFVLAYETVSTSSLIARFPMGSPPSGRAIARGGLVVLALGIAGSVLYVASLPDGYDSVLSGRSLELSQSLKSTSRYLLFAPTLLVPACLLLLAAWLKTRNHWHLVLSVGALLLVVAIKGPAGSRLTLLPLFAGLAVFLYLVRGSRPRLAALALVLALGVFAWSFLGEARTASNKSSEGVGRIAERLITDPEQLIEPVTVGQDAGMAPALAAAISIVPDRIPYRYGLENVTDLLARGVPSSIWPEKPVPVRERYIKALWPEGYRQSIANPEPSVLFSFYVEFGFFSVLLGMALIGVLFRFAWEFLLAHGDRILVLLAYSVFLASVPTILRDGPVDSFVKTGFMLIPIVAVAWLARPREPTVSHP